MIPSDLLDVITIGDCRDLAPLLPDESVDVIATDPPYHDEFLWAWAWLSEVGARVLRPGGLLLAYSGKHALPEVYAGLASQMRYFWTFAAVQLNGDTRFHKRRVFSNWRPILAYTKPTADSGAAACLNWVGDAKESKRDKRYHAWGQGANVFEFYLDRLTLPGAIVLEPFCGGGTVPAVCKALGRPFVAFEVDPEAAEVARRRVEAVTLPLWPPAPDSRGAQLELTGCPAPGG